MSDKNFRVRHGLEVDGNATITGTATAEGADIGNITVGVADDNTITTTTGNLNVTADSAGYVNIVGENTAPTLITRNTNSTNVSVRSLSLDVESSGTPAVGFGNSLEWQLEAQPGNTERAGFIDVRLADTTPSSENFTMNFGLMQNGSAYTSKMVLDSTGSLDIDNDLTINGINVNLAQSTRFNYSDNNNRLNRPTVQSTSGNTSGFRVEAPNATSSATAISSVFNTDDPNNGKFINIRADGSAGPLSIRTGEYVAGVFGASGNSIDIYDGSTLYASINPAGPTVNTDLATKLYVDSNDNNTTYDFAATTAIGGANLNLTGSDSTTDTVKLSDGTGVTVSYVSGTEVSVAIGQPVATTDSVTFADVTANGVVVGSSANTISGTTLAIDGETAGGGSVTLNATDSTLGGGAGQLIVDTAALTYTHTDGSLVPGVTGTWSFNPSGTTSFPSYTFPYPDGTPDQLLKTDGSGNLSWFTPTDLNTTYDFNATSTTGGANLNLVGSDATTDTVKLTNGGYITATYTSGTEITLGSNATDANTASTIVARDASGNFSAGQGTFTGVKIDGSSSGSSTFTAPATGSTLSYVLPGSAGTANTVLTNDGSGNLSWALPGGGGSTFGNVSIGVDTDQTISTTSGNLILQTAAGVNTGTITMTAGSNGDITLDPNGSGEIILGSVTRLQGEMQASTNLNYAFPAQTLMTVTDNNGYSAASSMPASTNGYGANAGFIHYFGDTLAGNNTTGAFNFKVANGNSTTDTVPFTGIAGVAPSAVTTSSTFGTLNFNGYGTTGFINDVGTANQGGGINAVHNLQTQGYAAENLSDSTLTLTSTNVTAVASSFRAALGAPQVTGTKGQISFNATTPGVGNAIRVTGTLTGTATGIVSGNNYWIIATNGSTTATLSATPGGSPIDTTAGTLTGLTLTRCGVTFTTTGLTSVPFGRGAKVAVTNVTNVTDGTYPVFATPTTTSFALGIPHTVAPTLPGTQTFSCTTTYGMGGLRVRSYPAAVPMNQQNRLDILDITPSTATFRSDSFTFAAGGYGNTGATFATLSSAEFKPSVPVRYATTSAGNFAGGSTYTPAATVTNGVSATINSGTGGFTIDLANLLSSGESAHYQFYINNTSGSNQQVTTTGGVVNINHNLASGSSMMATVYIVDTAAFCEHIA